MSSEEYYHQGNEHRRRGDFPAAMNCYLQAIALDPNSPAVVAEKMLEAARKAAEGKLNVRTLEKLAQQGSTDEKKPQTDERINSYFSKKIPFKSSK